MLWIQRSRKEKKMNKKILFSAFFGMAVLGFGSYFFAQIERKAPPEGARVYLISPADGDTVTSPVTVKFGLEGMGVAPAGVKYDHTGHHHILVDVDQLPDMNLPIPADEHHVHFGGGQTETQLKLAPGTHTLQLLVADELHVPHNPPVISKKITIHVK